MEEIDSLGPQNLRLKNDSNRKKKIFSEFSIYHISDAQTKIYATLVKSNSVNIKLLIEILIEEITRVVFEQFELEN